MTGRHFSVETALAYSSRNPPDLSWRSRKRFNETVETALSGYDQRVMMNSAPMITAVAMPAGTKDFCRI